jgi:hypothetical protein
MKVRQLYFFAAALLFFIFSGRLSAQTSTLNSVSVKGLAAAPSAGSIKVSWKSESESGVAHFELHRRSGSSGGFTCIRDNISPLGDYHNYSIDDDVDLFKTDGTLLQYFVRVIMTDGSSRDSEIISASYNSTSSAAKRTWGSIKAMFR